MNARTKSALLLGATLLVGALLGAVGSNMLFNDRLEQIERLRTRGGFTERIEAVIEPQDEAQRAAVRAVLEHSHDRFLAARRQCAAILAVGRDSLRTELAPLLTSEQQTRLDEWFARDRQIRREGSRRHRRGDGPRDRPRREPPR